MGRRGILPSLGAGTSLIVAGVLLLAVVSSIIAFRGFPGFGPEVSRPPVRLVAPAADRRAGRNAPAPIVVGATAGTTALTAPVRRQGARGSERAHADAPAVRIGTAPAGGSGSSPAPPVADPVTDPVTVPPAATPSAARPDTGTDTTPTASPRPVRQTVDRVRDVAAPVQPPPAPPAVQPIVDEAAGVVDTANDAVDQAADAADDVVGSVLPGPGTD